MAKKSFKDDIDPLDRLFSEPEQKSVSDQTPRTPEPHSADYTQSTENTYSTHKTQKTDETQAAYYRLNLKLRAEFRQYLDDESWKARISITEYINRLIAADMTAKQGIGR